VAVPILVLVLLASLMGGCAGDGQTRLTVTFRITGQERTHEYDIDCEGMTPSVPDPERVCDQVFERSDALFPAPGVECSLPVPTLYADISGTYAGEEVHLTVTPCTDAGHRALDEWV
jgi:hypothetical protein